MRIRSSNSTSLSERSTIDDDDENGGDPGGESFVVPVVAAGTVLNGSTPVRKTLSCSFWNVSTESWQKQGTLVRGFSVAAAGLPANNDTSDW